MGAIPASAWISPLPACGERSDRETIRVRGISFDQLPLTPTLSLQAGRGGRIAPGVVFHLKVAPHPNVAPHPEERALARVSKDEAGACGLMVRDASLRVAPLHEEFDLIPARAF
jgi:hypothetical protein